MAKSSYGKNGTDLESTLKFAKTKMNGERQFMESPGVDTTRRMNEFWDTTLPLLRYFFGAVLPKHQATEMDFATRYTFCLIPLNSVQ